MKRGKFMYKILGIALALVMAVAVSVSSLPPVRAQVDVVKAQLAILLDGSGSIGKVNWNIIVTGLADAVEDSLCIPHDGSVELTVVNFSISADVAVGPVVITSGSAASVASAIRNIPYPGGGTCISCAFNTAANALKNSVYFSPSLKQVINLVSDGDSISPSLDEVARDNCITTLQMAVIKDVICAEAIGDDLNVPWLRDEIVFPQPGCDWPIAQPSAPCSGWVRQVADAQEFADTICEKIGVVVAESLDHFIGYLVAGNGTIGEVVQLEDQFVAINATVGSSEFFYNPVEKMHGSVTTTIMNPDHHLMVYSIDSQEEPQTFSVKVDNQFGVQSLNISGPFGLVVPTQKLYPGNHTMPVGLDHFLLYDVIGGQDVDVVVDLNDQFGEQLGVEVYEPVLFATPVQKTRDIWCPCEPCGVEVTEIVNPEWNLVIYEIELWDIVNEEIYVTNQFGEEQHAWVLGPDRLAVPSTERRCSLTIFSTSGGRVSLPGVGTFTYDCGTEVELDASASANCWFVDWTGDVVDDVNAATTTIFVNGDYYITANFECEECGGFISISVRDTPIAKVVQTLLGLLMLVSLPAALWVRKRRGRGLKHT